jgi:quercetin dioxygenase-like cupin family protein
LGAYTLRLLEDRIGPSYAVNLADSTTAQVAEHVIVYVVDGSVTVTDTGGDGSEGGPITLEPNRAWHGTPPGRLVAGGGGAHVLRFELGPQPPREPGEGAADNELVAATVILDPAAAHVLRCDRVDFPPGGVAYLHAHAGSGIRYLLTGQLRVETGQIRTLIRPHGAWFEYTDEPVFAAASASEPTAFVRVMVLPGDYQGKRSIRYLRREDEDKPKPQRYQMLVDAPIRLAVRTQG